MNSFFGFLFSGLLLALGNTLLSLTEPVLMGLSVLDLMGLWIALYVTARIAIEKLEAGKLAAGRPVAIQILGQDLSAAWVGSKRPQARVGTQVWYS